ncbi:unnamed protein product [Heterobilharzia americana]|nr:unnamed protein product [Heterobilharzia americana]
MVLFYISFLIELSLPSSLSVTETEKLPHFALRGFLSTNDILYFHFSIPRHTFSSKLSISATFHDCIPESIILLVLCLPLINFMFSRTMRAGSLPLIRPFGVPVPNGVVMPTNSYTITIPTFEPFNSTFIADDCGVYSHFHIKSTNLRNAANIDIRITSPVIGLWFVGTYMTILAQKECIAWLLPSVRHDISTVDGHISYSENAQSKHKQSVNIGRPVSENNNGFHSQSTFDPRVTEKLFHRKKRRKPLYRSAIHSTADQPKSSSLPITSSSTESVKRYSHNSRNMSFIVSPFDIELAPMENRLYTLTVMDEMTSVDIILEECKIVTPIAPSLGNISESKKSYSTTPEGVTGSSSNSDLLHEMTFNPNLCPVIIDASAGALTPSLSYLDQHKGFESWTENKSDIKEDVTLNADARPSSILNQIYQSGIHRTFRLLGLRGSQTDHYFYILNKATHVAVYIRLAVVPKFGKFSYYVVNPFDLIKAA